VEVLLSEFTEDPWRVVFEFEVVFRRWGELVASAVFFIKWALRKFISDTISMVGKKSPKENRSTF
jgi:hypothetical protein